MPIKQTMTLWVAKLKVRVLTICESALPIHSVKRANLQARCTVWELETGGFEAVTLVDDGDVYNGHPFEWSRKPIPPAVADKLMELHDAAAEGSLDKQIELRETLDHYRPS